VSSSVGMVLLKIIRDRSAIVPSETDHVPDEPLSPGERRAVRYLLRDAAFSKRFWSTFRLWLSWTTGSIIFVLTFWDRIKAYFPNGLNFWGKS
jgi:hypothetical protein